MMRKFKFRKWDEEEQTMIDGDSLAFEEYAPLAELLNQNGVMQFTGLFDKNGTEVYEGDVVRHNDYTGGAFFGVKQPTRDIVVKWDDDQFTYQFKGFGFTFKSEKAEVIGNIYENPELLKEESK